MAHKKIIQLNCFDMIIGRTTNLITVTAGISLIFWVSLLILLLQSALQPLVGFRPAQLSLNILSRKVLQSAVASGTSNTNLEGNQGFRAFQLSPQEAPSV
jgi:hypothetical protein